MNVPGTPLSSIHNILPAIHKSLEGTPVGDRDSTAKIQLCIELRKKKNITKTKAVVTKEKNKSQDTLQPVLEVTVMYVKNLPEKQKTTKKPLQTFVKVTLKPGGVIHSTEIKKLDGKLDFIEVFTFDLNKAEDIQNKTIEVSVCDSQKMTRNATIFGKTEIDVGGLGLGNPVTKWYNLTIDG